MGFSSVKRLFYEQKLRFHRFHPCLSQKEMKTMMYISPKFGHGEFSQDLATSLKRLVVEGRLFNLEIKLKISEERTAREERTKQLLTAYKESD
uniref:Uncharacterized protein n=1 Tax=Noccaea caerulescens TaxID=107243 RepID=A0A1J3IWV1_NOCCA